MYRLPGPDGNIDETLNLIKFGWTNINLHVAEAMEPAQVLRPLESVHHDAVGFVEARVHSLAVRRGLALAASVVLVISYLPTVFGPVSGLSPKFHAATLGVMAGTVVLGVLAAVCGRAEPDASDDERRGKRRGLLVVAFCLAVCGWVLYTLLGVWSYAHIAHWDNYYCNVSRFPGHRSGCMESMYHFTSGFRDAARAALFFIIVLALADERTLHFVRVQLPARTTRRRLPQVRAAAGANLARGHAPRVKGPHTANPAARFVGGMNVPTKMGYRFNATVPLAVLTLDRTYLTLHPRALPIPMFTDFRVRLSDVAVAFRLGGGPLTAGVGIQLSDGLVGYFWTFKPEPVLAALHRHGVPLDPLTRRASGALRGQFAWLWRWRRSRPTSVAVLPGMSSLVLVLMPAALVLDVAVIVICALAGTPAGWIAGGVAVVAGLQLSRAWAAHRAS